MKVPHAHLRIGDLCPKCRKAKLYLVKMPARIIRIVAQPVFQATIYELERLRCALCGALFTAPAPPQAGNSKYDPSVGIMLAIQRYGAGQPMYRTDKWQNHFEVPLAASTQWELIDAASETPEIIYETLIDIAAQGSLFHNDDTPMRVLSLHDRDAFDAAAVHIRELDPNFQPRDEEQQQLMRVMARILGFRNAILLHSAIKRTLKRERR